MFKGKQRQALLEKIEQQNDPEIKEAASDGNIVEIIE